MSKQSKPDRERSSLRRRVSGQILPANKLENVRRRAERAGGYGFDGQQECCVTCPASRHVMMMADALAKGKRYYMFDEEPDHCASGIYAVLECLWKLRREVKRLTANAERSNPATP